jgi:hypothetical protein
MTLLFFDGYRDKPVTRRGQLEQRIRELKCASWADPGGGELRAQIEKLEAELAVLDRGNGSAV